MSDTNHHPDDNSVNSKGQNMTTWNVTIESVQFPGVFLRMDGSGNVNCQFGAGPWEKFLVTSPGDGYVTIQSIQFQRFLCIDPQGQTTFNGNGFGHVSGVTDSSNSLTKIKSQVHPDGFSTFEANPDGSNIFLRMDSKSGIAPSPDGFGIVNCQLGVGPWEKFTVKTFA
jgi:hypothetical protein